MTVKRIPLAVGEQQVILYTGTGDGALIEAAEIPGFMQVVVSALRV